MRYIYWSLLLLVGLAVISPIPSVLVQTAVGSPADTLNQESVSPDSIAGKSIASDTVEFKSGYGDVVQLGGATSVGADLRDDDVDKNPLFEINAARTYLAPYYNIKRKLNDKIRLAVGVDYSFLNQFSNFSTTDRQAASGIFRVFGTWRIFGSILGSSGNLV